MYPIVYQSPIRRSFFHEVFLHEVENNALPPCKSTTFKWILQFWKRQTSLFSRGLDTINGILCDVYSNYSFQIVGIAIMTPTVNSILVVELMEKGVLLLSSIGQSLVIRICHDVKTS